MSEEANASTDTTEATAAATTEGAEVNVTDAAATAETAEAKATNANATAEGADPEAFALAAPEGAEAYQADFDKFAGDMDSWLKANPAATAREALTEAAKRRGGAT